MFWTKKKTEAEKNADSIREIPDSLITASRRETYIQRALLGQDVYAYYAGPNHFWNIWDGEIRQRIELGVEHG